MNSKIKAIFFAQYLGQPIEYNFNQKQRQDTLLGISQTLCLFSRDGNLDGKALDKCHLLLRSINDLTDEEVIEACVLHYGEIRRDKIASATDRYKKNLIAYCLDTIIVNQYFLRIGIALPFTHLNDQNQPEIYSVEKLVELGWVMIKTNK